MATGVGTCAPTASRCRGAGCAPDFGHHGYPPPQPPPHNKNQTDGFSKTDTLMMQVRRLQAHREDYLKSLQEWESILFDETLNQWLVEVSCVSHLLPIEAHSLQGLCVSSNQTFPCYICCQNCALLFDCARVGVRVRARCKEMMADGICMRAGSDFAQHRRRGFGKRRARNGWHAPRCC